MVVLFEYAWCQVLKQFGKLNFYSNSLLILNHSSLVCETSNKRKCTFYKTLNMLR